MVAEGETRPARAAAAARRSRLYGLLAEAFRYPSDELCEAVANGWFQGQVQAAMDGLPFALPAGDLVGAPPGLAEVHLQGIYTALFDVGSPAGPPCYLYEAEYGGGRLGVMEDVLRFYRFFGLRLAEDERERPDHLATELEFLHSLTYREAEALAKGNTEAAPPMGQR